MEITWTVAAALVGIWLIVLLFQLSDLGANWLNALNARDIPGRGGRTHPRAVLWMPPVAALLAVAVMLGADWSGRLLFGGQPWTGVLALLALAVVLVAVALGALVVLRQRTVPSYALLREKLRRLKGTKIGKEQLAGLHRELDTIDAGHRHGHSASQVVARAVPPRSALAPLARTSAWRLLPTVLAVAALVAVCIAAIGTPYWPLCLLAVLLPVVSVLLGISSARVSRLSRSAWGAVYQRQRAEVVVELDELERRAGRGVPGLSDRVSRALRILREQQG